MCYEYMQSAFYLCFTLPLTPTFCFYMYTCMMIPLYAFLHMGLYTLIYNIYGTFTEDTIAKMICAEALDVNSATLPHLLEV